MDPIRFREVKEALLRARSLGPAERAAFLGELSVRDEALRVEVESLLAAEDRPAPIVDGGVLPARVGIEAADAVPAPMPERIGPYRVRALLGVGGMGTVYRVEQEAPIRREVALKVIRGQFAPEWVVQRFEAERQALAMMNHPNIARVYDAGADEAGHPWFAMELVPGEPITTYCDDQRLDTRARLGLFLQLCDAIQHAHQRGVIHRDLKPSNVLVARGDAGPVLKVIDFGIAKALDPGAFDSGGVTRTGHVIGTPSYMSPEQAGLVRATVDTRTDVYALGVMLYELLCGARPFEAADESLAADMPRRDVEPQRPSTRLATGRAAASDDPVARNRGTSTTRLRRELSGDLDNVALMALRREPDRRYASVERFASDVRRHLDGLPVAARPDTWRYRSSKFVRRHQAGVAVAGASALAVIGFVIALAVESGRLADQRDRARSAEQAAEASAQRARDEAAVARETADFLRGLFAGVDPDRTHGRELTARGLLDHGARDLESGLIDQPAVRARLLVTLAQAYHSFADYGRAGPLAESALAIQRALRPARDADLAGTLAFLSTLAHDRRDFPASAAYAREVVAIRRRLYGNRSADVAMGLSDLAVAERAMERYAEAESLLRTALDIHRATLPANDPELAWDLNMLGFTRFNRGDLPEAERCFREALAIQRDTLEAPNSEIAGTLNNLGGLEMVSGNAAAAESTLREALDMYRALYGEDHPAVGRAYQNYANALREGGQEARARPFLRASLVVMQRTVGPSHEFVSNGLLSLGACRRDLGDFAGSDSCLRAALAIRRRLFGRAPGHGTALVEMERAELAFDRGDAAHAVELARTALPVLERELPRDDGHLARGRLVLGESLTASGHAGDAETLLREALTTLERTLPEGHWRIAEAKSALGACLLELGRRQDARLLLEAGASGLRRTLDPADVRTRLADSRRAKARLS